MFSLLGSKLYFLLKSDVDSNVGSNSFKSSYLGFPTTILLSLFSKPLLILLFKTSTSSLLAIAKSPPKPANANARPTADVSQFSSADVLLTNPAGLKEYYLEGTIYVSEGYTT